MSRRKWLVIARNQYRINTSAIRWIRPYFPYLAIGFLAVYVLFIAPAVVGLFMKDFLSFIITQAAIPIMQILLFVFFFLFLMFPISDTLREAQSSQLEILVASPAKPGDFLLGEFIGGLPFYAIAITVFTGIFTALLSPLGLGLAQNVIIIAAFIVTFLSAFWIGIVISAVLRTKLGKTSHGKDLGRALAVIIALPPIALIYAIMGGGLIQALVDPSTNEWVRALLGLLPSSWGAEIFVDFAANPGNVFALGLETLTRLGGLFLFFAAVLFLGRRLANRAYTLEDVSFTVPRVKPDGVFYKTVKYLGGNKSFGTLLTSIFKDYARRVENLSWIVYAVILTVMIQVFLTDKTADSIESISSLGVFAIPLLSGFIVGTVSRGKETLFMLKKAPGGISRFVKTKLTQSLFVAVPFAAVLTAILALLSPQVTLPLLLLSIALGLLRTVAMVPLFLGLALVIPTFSEKSRERNLSIMINLMIIIFATIGLEIGFSRVGLRLGKLFPNISPLIGVAGDDVLMTATFLLAGALLLYVGARKLTRIE